MSYTPTNLRFSYNCHSPNSSNKENDTQSIITNLLTKLTSISNNSQILLNSAEKLKKHIGDKNTARKQLIDYESKKKNIENSLDSIKKSANYIYRSLTPETKNKNIERLKGAIQKLEIKNNNILNQLEQNCLNSENKQNCLDLDNKQTYLNYKDFERLKNKYDKNHNNKKIIDQKLIEKNEKYDILYKKYNNLKRKLKSQKEKQIGIEQLGFIENFIEKFENNYEDLEKKLGNKERQIEKIVRVFENLKEKLQKNDEIQTKYEILIRENKTLKKEYDRKSEELSFYLRKKKDTDKSSKHLENILDLFVKTGFLPEYPSSNYKLYNILEQNISLYIQKLSKLSEENQELSKKLEETEFLSKDLESTLAEKFRNLNENFQEQLAKKEMEIGILRSSKTRPDSSENLSNESYLILQQNIIRQESDNKTLRIQLKEKLEIINSLENEKKQISQFYEDKFKGFEGEIEKKTNEIKKISKIYQEMMRNKGEINKIKGVKKNLVEIINGFENRILNELNENEFKYEKLKEKIEMLINYFRNEKNDWNLKEEQYNQNIIELEQIIKNYEFEYEQKNQKLTEYENFIRENQEELKEKFEILNNDNEKNEKIKEFEILIREKQMELNEKNEIINELTNKINQFENFIKKNKTELTEKCELLNENKNKIDEKNNEIMQKIEIIKENKIKINEYEQINKIYENKLLEFDTINNENNKKIKELDSKNIKIIELENIITTIKDNHKIQLNKMEEKIKILENEITKYKENFIIINENNEKTNELEKKNNKIIELENMIDKIKIVEKIQLNNIEEKSKILENEITNNQYNKKKINELEKIIEEKNNEIKIKNNDFQELKINHSQEFNSIVQKNKEIQDNQGIQLLELTKIIENNTINNKKLISDYEEKIKFYKTNEEISNNNFLLSELKINDLTTEIEKINNLHEKNIKLKDTEIITLNKQINNFEQINQNYENQKQTIINYENIIKNLQSQIDSSIEINNLHHSQNFNKTEISQIIFSLNEKFIFFNSGLNEKLIIQIVKLKKIFTHLFNLFFQLLSKKYLNFKIGFESKQMKLENLLNNFENLKKLIKNQSQKLENFKNEQTNREQEEENSLISLETLKAEIVNITGSVSKLNNERNELEENLIENNIIISKVENENIELHEIIAKNESEKRKLIEENEELNLKIIENKEYYEEMIKKFEDEVIFREKILIENNEKIDDLKERLKTINEEKKNMIFNLKENQKIIDLKTKQYNEYFEDLRDTKQKNENLSKENCIIKEINEILTKKNNDLNTENQQLSSKILETDKLRQKMNDLILEYSTKINHINDTLQQTQQENDNLKALTAKLSEDNVQKDNELNEIRQTLKTKHDDSLSRRSLSIERDLKAKSFRDCLNKEEKLNRVIRVIMEKLEFEERDMLINVVKEFYEEGNKNLQLLEKSNKENSEIINELKNNCEKLTEDIKDQEENELKFMAQNTVLKNEISVLEKKINENKIFHEKEHLKVMFIKYMECLLSKEEHNRSEAEEYLTVICSLLAINEQDRIFFINSINSLHLNQNQNKSESAKLFGFFKKK